MRVGEQFEHYVVVEHIGRGGMADVWSARDERLHRTVAIKTIMADVSNEQTRVQFEHEARTIAALEHSNILPIYDFGEIERQLYIVMRYVAGGSLLDRIVEVGALSDAEALRVGEAISTALERAHAEKIVHRDLKPANVLLDRFGTPYLADFGLAAVVGAGDDDSLSSGTLIYMPPEQMFGQAVDHRSDIYAFAVMLFQMITGEFPFEGKAALCLKQVQEGEELPDPRRYRPDLSDQVANVLRIATAMDIEARFDSASELMSEVSAALQGQTLFSKEVGGRGVGPSQEPLPYHAETEVAVDDEMLATMPGVMDDKLLNTVDFDSSLVDSEIDVKRREAAPEALMVDDATYAHEPAALQEARQLFRRMVRTWARGQGRFLTGATHFASIHSYYSDAESHGLEVDDSGREAMLRGAIEHNYGLDYWLDQVSDIENRRIIFLHALRSDLAAARALAVRLLRNVPETESGSIAMTVGRLLHSETSPEVRYEVVSLLEHRGDHPAAWREYAFAMDTDLLLAEQALRTDAPEVAELAARAIGKLRAQAAAVYIASHAEQNPAEVRNALTWIRDEVDSLPVSIPSGLRGRAFWRLTQQYVTSRIGRFGLRYFLAILGTGVGIGAWVYWFLLKDWSSLVMLLKLYSATGQGQSFGLIAGLGAALGAALPFRLAGSSAEREDGATLWTWWARLLVGVLIGGLVGGIAYLNFQVIVLNWNYPNYGLALLGGIGLVLGAAIGATFRWPVLARTALTGVTVFAVLYVTWRLYLDGAILDPIIQIRDEAKELWLYLLMAIGPAIGVNGPEIVDSLRRVWRRTRS